MGILFSCIVIYKIIVGIMIKHAISNQSHAVAVSTMKVDYSMWQPTFTASGSLRAMKGVNVTTELAGMVKAIYFKPGSMVIHDTILVQLNADAEIGQLQSLEAQAELAKITYERDKKQYKVQAISQQTLDTDVQTLKNLQGQVNEQKAIVAKKTIRAPFSGHLGINYINPGQYINPGDTIVTLQTLNPMWVDFFIPQQALNQLKIGKAVTVTTDSYPEKNFKGTITAINPVVDITTRNVQVEATIFNPTSELVPGMFVTVVMNTDKPQYYLTLPQSAISFNPYGDIVYIVKQDGKNKNQKPLLKATQAFIQAGDKRGDQIAILKGLKKGDTVVTSGMLKLKNNSQITINNSIMPLNNSAPLLNNDY
jgi:membrane fusion protein (multidrug efflux system)